MYYDFDFWFSADISWLNERGRKDKQMFLRFISFLVLKCIVILIFGSLQIFPDLISEDARTNLIYTTFKDLETLNYDEIGSQVVAMYDIHMHIHICMHTHIYICVYT